MQTISQYKSKGKQTLDVLRKELLYGHKNSQLNCGFFIDPYRFGGGIVGGWKELARVSGTTQSIDISTIPAKRYYKLLLHAPSIGIGVNPRLKYGSGGTIDTGATTADRYSVDGAADATETTINNGTVLDASGAGWSGNGFVVGYLSNYATKEKLTQLWQAHSNTAGAGTAPNRLEACGKWANTTNAFDILRADTISSTWGSGTEMVLLGYDPADTHTTNFWTELDSVTLGSPSNTFSTNTFAGKKYLWWQAYIKFNTASNSLLRYNGDGGNNYSQRQSENGSIDGSDVSIGHANILKTTTTTPYFINCFVINVSANEKLSIYHHVKQNTAGAGTAPTRTEGTFKWANTASQITSIGFTGDTTNTLDTGSMIKVWGSN